MAELQDEEHNARERKAVVHVQTDGVRMVDPSTKPEPKLDEAHLQYRLDNGPTHLTTSKNWAFENLSPGEHTIHITLMANDNQPVGKEKVLKVRIP